MAQQVILCVDDEKMILDSLIGQLRRRFGERYLLEGAENTEEAWEVIQELSEEEVEVLIIVSDWLMPGIKGDEFLIQVHQAYPNIVKVLLTGQAEETAINRAREHANLHSCIRKPWDEEELIAIIENGMERS